MTNLLGILGRHGPVRRTTAGRYRTWCPVCEHPGALLVVTGQYGERPSSCATTGCSIGSIAAAIRRLEAGEQVRPDAKGVGAQNQTPGLTTTSATTPPAPEPRHRGLDTTTTTEPA
jgi:hypothetical protein